MSRLRANEITNRMANGAPTVSNGLVISGVSTHVGLSQFQNTINLTHASAGQNYIYFNEDLQFAKNGTGTRLKIDSGGRVLIGETSVAGSTQKLVIGNGGAENFEFSPAMTSNNLNGGLIEYLHRGDGNTRPDLNLYTGGAGNIKLYTNGNERLRVGTSGQIGLGGANYGSSGQVLTSQGSGSAPTWATTTSATATPRIDANNTVSGQRIASDLTYSSGNNGTNYQLGNVSGCNASSVYALEISLTYMHNGSTNHGYLTCWIYQRGKTYNRDGSYYSEQHYDWYYNVTFNRSIIPWDPSGTQALDMYVVSAYNTNSGNKFYVDLSNKLQNI